MQEKRIAPLIVKKIFEEAEFTVSTLALMSSKNTVAAVYTGLVSFFVFDSNMDNDLIQRLKMEYQSRLLRDHSGSEFENYSHTIDDAYARFSLNGVRNAYTSTEWNEKNAAYYVDTVIEMIGAQSNDYNKELVMETVSRLYRAVTKDYSKEKVPLDKPSNFGGVFQFVYFCLLYYAAWKGAGFIAPGLHRIIDSTDSVFSVVGMIFLYAVLPFAMAIFIHMTYRLIIRNSMTGFGSGIMMFLVVYTHAVGSLIEEYNVYEDLSPNVGAKLLFYSVLIVFLVFFFYPRFDRYKD